MNGREFYDYIMENYEVSGDASRLIGNILGFVEGQNLPKVKAQDMVWELLNGSIGLSRREISKIDFTA